MTLNTSRWICCQLGAREHYAIPRALYSNGCLVALITDAWVNTHSLVSYLPNARLKERFHSDLSQAKVYHSTSQLIGFELSQKSQKFSRWDLITSRNNWFQKRAVRQLKSMVSELTLLENSPVIFAYSYAALEIFQYAKQQNWVTVLGQIDPGPVEEQIVTRLHKDADFSPAQWQPAPSYYWDTWRRECDLADHIIVNSAWSKQALVKAAVKEAKIQVIPLAYQVPKKSFTFKRKYPESFTQERPCRILFLGQVNLRKGILPLLQALDVIEDMPAELWVVGRTQFKLPHKWLSHPKIHWVGSVPRGTAGKYYQQADLFILPTYSDGFALTQLEAAAWKLPLIVSSHCGEVVEHQVNGFILSKVNAFSIAEALKFCISNPQELASMSSRATTEKNSLENLERNIEKILTE